MVAVLDHQVEEHLDDEGGRDGHSEDHALRHRIRRDGRVQRARDRQLDAHPDEQDGDGVQLPQREIEDDDAREADEEGQATAARAPDASRSSLRIIRVSVDDGGSSPALELVQTIEVGERCSSAQFARGGDVLHIYGAQRWQS